MDIQQSTPNEKDMVVEEKVKSDSSSKNSSRGEVLDKMNEKLMEDDDLERLSGVGHLACKHYLCSTKEDYQFLHTKNSQADVKKN